MAQDDEYELGDDYEPLIDEYESQEEDELQEDEELKPRRKQRASAIRTNLKLKVFISRRFCYLWQF